MTRQIPKKAGTGASIIRASWSLSAKEGDAGRSSKAVRRTTRSIEDWCGDARYPAMIVKVLNQHLESFIFNESLKGKTDTLALPSLRECMPPNICLLLLPSRSAV